MSSQNTVYLNLREITELHKPDIQVKDVAEVYCSDAHVQNRCASLKIKTIREQKRKRYVENALNVIRIMEAADSSVTVSNVGKVEFIIDYQPKVRQNLFWQWCKTIFVCVICFCGAAFAIMTFNNDVSVTSVFGEVYRLLTGQEPVGIRFWSCPILWDWRWESLSSLIISRSGRSTRIPHRWRWRCGFMRITSARL